MENLKRGMLNLFRKYFYDPAKRGTSQVDSFSGNGVLTTFTLTKKPLMYITSVVINGSTLKMNRDYYVDFGTGTDYGKILFVTAPTTGTNNIVITYKYGNNWIYPGTPQTDNKQLPRIGFFLVGANHKPAGVSEVAEFIDATFRLSIWVKSGDEYTIGSYTYSGDKLLDYLYNDISQKIINFRRDYYEPYNVITMKIIGVIDIPFDEENKFNRKELSINVNYKKVYA